VDKENALRQAASRYLNDLRIKVCFEMPFGIQRAHPPKLMQLLSTDTNQFQPSD
jgi:hypothetical protein